MQVRILHELEANNLATAIGSEWATTTMYLSQSMYGAGIDANVA